MEVVAACGVTLVPDHGRLFKGYYHLVQDCTLSWEKRPNITNPGSYGSAVLKAAQLTTHIFLGLTFDKSDAPSSPHVRIDFWRARYPGRVYPFGSCPPGANMTISLRDAPSRHASSSFDLFF
jgi:hypothetical protein